MAYEDGIRQPPSTNEDSNYGCSFGDNIDGAFMNWQIFMKISYNQAVYKLTEIKDDLNMLWLAFILTFQHSVRENGSHLAIFLSNLFSNEITCNTIISYHCSNKELKGNEQEMIRTLL